MIEKTTSFKTSDGAIHATVEMAQQHELKEFLIRDSGIDEIEAVAPILVVALLKHKDHIIDLLTMKASSRPKARKTNGATRKPRAPKPSTQPNEAGQQ